MACRVVERLNPVSLRFDSEDLVRQSPQLSMVIGTSCDAGSIGRKAGAVRYSCIQAMGYLSAATTLKHDIS